MQFSSGFKLVASQYDMSNLDHTYQNKWHDQKTKRVPKYLKTSYGPIFHQRQELPAHFESLFGGLHRAHHSILQYSVEYGCPGTISLFSV